MIEKVKVIEGNLGKPNGMTLTNVTFMKPKGVVGILNAKKTPNFPDHYMVVLNGKGVSFLSDRNYRIYVKESTLLRLVHCNEEDEIVETELVPATVASGSGKIDNTPIDDSHLTDDEIKARIDDRFRTLSEIVARIANGDNTGLVVYGAPGIGKSYSVEETLAGMNNDFQLQSGKITPGGLFDTMYKYQDKGNVIVMDDCDSALYDETSLNLLKTALDTKEQRVVSWTSRRESEIPPRFRYSGGVIFITNTDFEAEVRKDHKISKDLEAILDRSLYLNLTINTVREKMIRIRQVAFDYGLLAKKGLNASQSEDVMDYIETYKNDFRHLSVRRLTILAGLCKSGGNWRRIANQTTLNNSRFR